MLLIVAFSPRTRVGPAPAGRGIPSVLDGPGWTVHEGAGVDYRTVAEAYADLERATGR